MVAAVAVVLPNEWGKKIEFSCTSSLESDKIWEFTSGVSFTERWYDLRRTGLVQVEHWFEYVLHYRLSVEVMNRIWTLDQILDYYVLSTIFHASCDLWVVAVYCMRWLFYSLIVPDLNRFSIRRKDTIGGRVNQRIESSKQNFDLDEINIQVILREWNCLSD